MGSIIDAYLTPLCGSGIDAEATNDEMRRLVEASDAGSTEAEARALAAATGAATVAETRRSNSVTWVLGRRL